MSQAADVVLVSQSPEGVTLVTLNDPERRNALSLSLRLRLLEVLRAEAADPRTKVLVLTGAGKGFCAGGDISAMGQGSGVSIPRMKILHDIARELAVYPKPVIAAVNGAAFGAGVSLALLCDRIFLAPDAKLGVTFGKMGLAPDTGFLWSACRRLPRARVLQIVMDSAVFDASEALDEGLVDAVADDVVEVATAAARALIPAAPLPFALARRALVEMDGGLDLCLSHELRDQGVLYDSADHLEAVAAFKEKRTPVFSGR
ncbi:enoyl-CoA hydratase/isomerase family protein [Falsigemmobacter faecalis]|uniref:Enoyl-CoA hydratase/isomerase family protein n=1 Tax=Falsigemmobacter faecalis TaxID=2488730 RepID=A0A3P3DQS4_9RHOB|nr:enoyl-CoA hydratase-related protein [Falsigemmobacter faecalis]RRH76610.1 hypothetical protein EG244_05415 [Falsigemmobacter faecalis]